jgi:hypothetical protein
MAMKKPMSAWMYLLQGVRILALGLALAGSQVVANPALPTNSHDAHIRNLLLSGKVADALSFAKEHHGRVPVYLNKYAEAFSVDNQRVGNCQAVARALQAGLSRLGARAEYLAIKSEWDYPVFRLLDGREKTLSHSGYHVVVRVEGMIYDAYTGPTGMKLADYLSRIIVPDGATVFTQVVQKP